MDEVMADTLGHALQWLGQQYDLHIDRAALRGHSLRDKLAPAPLQALEAHMHSGAFFADIPLMPDSQAVVAALGQHYDIWIVTAAMDYPRSCHAKFDWLQRHFPNIDKDRYVFCGDKRIVRADILVDDSPRHFSHFEGRGILFDSPLNHNDPHPERAHHWRDVGRLLRA